MSSFSDKLVNGFINHGWFFVWVVFFATIIYAFHEHGEHWADVKEASGCARARAISKFALLWLIPFLALLGAIASQLWADRADKNIDTLLANFTAATNDLAIANRASANAQKAAKEAQMAVRPKPLDERLRILLNRIDETLLPALKTKSINGRLTVNGTIRLGDDEQLEKLCLEPDAGKFITLHPIPSVSRMEQAGMPGVWKDVSFDLSTNLLNSSSQ